MKNYINYILLNEKIFTKFAEENQNKFWKEILELFTLYSNKLENYINITKICQLINIYDQKEIPVLLFLSCKFNFERK